MKKKSVADEYATIIASNLKKLLKDRGVSRDKVARDLNIGYSTLSNWLLGYNAPKMDKVQALAEYFGVDYTNIISNTSSNVDSFSLDKKSLENEKDRELMELIKSLNDKEKDILINVAKWLKDNSSK